MAEIRQKMRGTEAELDASTSVIGHLVYNVTQKELRVYDGVKVGGFRIMSFENTKTWLDAYIPSTGGKVANATYANDSDKLDAQHGSFYQNAANLNAGTLPNARLVGDYSFANLTLSANGNALQFLATSTSTTSNTSTAHGIQVGPTSGSNIAIGSNGVASRNNGAYAALVLYGSNITVQAIEPTIGYLNLSAAIVNITQRILAFGDITGTDAIDYNDSTKLFRFLGGGSEMSSRIQAGRFVASIQGTSFSTSSDFGGVMLIGEATATSYIAVTSETSVAGYFKRMNNGDCIVFRQTGSTNVGRVSITASATVYNTSSDERLKTDLKPIDTGILDQLAVWDFEWIREPGARAHGIMAQQMNGLIPQLVSHSTDEYEDENGDIHQMDEWSADYSRLTPLLVAVAKEQRAQIIDLRARIETLETA